MRALVPRPEEDSHVEPYQLIALAVIERALSDATSRGSGHYREWRKDARAFLSGGSELEFWLDVLGVDARQVRGLIARALNDN